MVEIFEPITESKKKYYITKFDSDGGEVDEFVFLEFNKSEIKQKFIEIANELKEGEEVQYSKGMWDIILNVVRKNGKLMREVTKGSKTLYLPYKGTL